MNEIISLVSWIAISRLSVMDFSLFEIEMGSEVWVQCSKCFRMFCGWYHPRSWVKLPWWFLWSLSLTWLEIYFNIYLSNCYISHKVKHKVKVLLDASGGKKHRKSKDLFENLHVLMDGGLFIYVYIYMHIYKSFDFCSVKANNNDNKIPKSTKSSKLKNALSILALRSYFLIQGFL